MNRALKFLLVFSLVISGVYAHRGQSQTLLTNTWSSAGHMTDARTGAAAVQLSDGRILIIGGSDSNGVPQATAEVYDPQAETFSAAPDMNVPRANHAAIVLSNGDVLVTGGLTTGGSYSDSAEIYSVNSRQWALLPSSIGAGLSGHAMALLSDGNVLIAGGTSTAKVVSSLVLYNVITETFTPIGTLQTPRTGAAAAATPDGRVLIVGGIDMNGAVLASTEIFVYSAETMSGSVSYGPTMVSARVGATATTTYDGVAVIGGNNGQSDLGTAEIFSQWTNTLRVVSGGTPRSDHFATMLPQNGSILVMGGTGGTKVDLLEPWANNRAGAFSAASDSLVNQDGGFGSPATLGSLLAAGGEGNFGSAAELYWFPTISTDKPDYSPGTPVEMTGTGFKPSETVDLHLHLWVDQSTEDVPDAKATADALGNFSYDGYAPNKNDIGARYHLTAVGESSGYQAQTIFTDGATYIVFTNVPLNQATGACGALTLSAGGGTAPYGTFYLYDSTTTGTFYSNSSCTTAITSVAGATTMNVWYKNTAASTPELMVCSTNAGSEANCEFDQAFFGAFLTSQTETIYSQATQLAWSTVPGNGAPGVALAPQPAVVVQDSGGHTVSASTASILLTLSTNPTGGGGTLTCTGGNPIPATSGTAQFSGCSISPAFSGQYCLKASSAGLNSTPSTCFYVSNPANAGTSTVVSSVVPPNTVLDNGFATATITVTLKDSSGNAVAGKTVTLQANAGTNSTISAASGLSSASGVVTFTVNDTSAETVTYTATDTTDGVVLTHTAQVIFQGGTVSNSTFNSSASASPTSVTDDGVSASTITVTLGDGNGNPVSGVTVTLAQSVTTGTATSIITPINGGKTNANGQAFFTVVDSTVQNVTYTASYTSTSNGSGTLSSGQQKPVVSFVASGTAASISLAGVPATAAYNNSFTATATVTPAADHNAISFSVTGVCSITGNTSTTVTVQMTASSGTCTVTAIVAASTFGTRYNSATTSVNVTASLATPATLTVTGAPASAVYNTTFTVSYAGGSGTGAVTFNATGACSNAGALVTMTSGTGTCSITATQAADANYAGQTSAAVTVQASTATATMSVTCPTVVYNGSPQTCSATTTPSGLNVTYTYNGNLTATNAGSYTVVGTISSSNYSGSGTATLVITPEPVTATAGSLTAVYTGSPIPITNACTLAGAFTANLSCANSPSPVGPDVGAGAVTPVVTAINGDALANYTITTVPGSWNITQATSGVTVNCAPGTFVYTGAAQTPCKVTVTGVGTPNQAATTVTYLGDNIDVGTVQVLGTFTGDADHQSSSGTGSFKITPAPVTATAGTLNSPFTGAPVAIPACVVTSASGFIGSVTCVDNPNSVGPALGSGTVTPVPSVASPDLLTNYTITLVPGTWSISNAAATITLSNLNRTYTGLPLPVTVTTTPTGLAYAVLYTGIGGTSYGPSSTAPTAAGTYTVTGTLSSPYAGQDTETETIGQAVPPMTLILDPGSSNPSVYGGSVLFDLTVSALTSCPTGTIQWYVNGAASGSPVAATCAMTFTTSALAPPSDTIYAVYSGDANNATATSNTYTQDVSTDTTSVNLTSSATTVDVGKSVTFTATITPNALASGDAGPAGTVNFYATPLPSGSPVLIGTQAVSGTSPYTAVLTLVANAADLLPQGAYDISATYVSSNGEFTGSTSTVPLDVTVAFITPSINWPVPTPIVYGASLGSAQLNATATDPTTTQPVDGTFTYAPAAGFVPPVGNDNLQVTFTPTDASTYTTNGASVTLTVTGATLTVTPDPQTMTYGGPIPTLTYQIAGFVNSDLPTVVSGTPNCSTTATLTSPVSPPTYPITCTIGSLAASNYIFSFVPGALTVTAGTSLTVATLPTASTIAFGQTLASSLLTGGTATYNNNPVTGTFAWTTPATAPPGGTNSYSVTFTPTTNPSSYNTATALVPLTVLPATPTVATPPTASAISVGQALSASTLSGGTVTFEGNTVAGTFTWTTPTLTPTPAGTYSESVTFTPTDTTDYNSVTATVMVTVNNKTTPTITAWPVALGITYGQTLAASTLTGGTASIAGTFAWTTPTTAPGAGTPSESVTFTPNDTTDYNTVTGSVTITVSMATPTVTVLPVASAISFGQTLAGSTLTGGTATFNSNAVPGTFAWTTPGTVPPVGADPESVTFTPTDTADYNTVTVSVTVTVNAKLTPTVTAWPTASTITYGQTLASSVLGGGTASVGGIFTWTTPATAPGAGAPSESVTFTPTDTTDYNTVTSSITVTVLKATPAVTAWPTAGAISVGQALSASTLTGGTATFNSNPVLGAFAWTTPGITPPVGADAESVTFTPTDTTDYNTVVGSVTVTVNNKTSPTVSAWPTASGITYGQTLTASTLTGGTASVAGTFAWTSPTTAPGAGTPSESVTFTPTDTTDYTTVAGSVTVAVSKATPTVTVLPTASAISLGQTLAGSTLTSGTATSSGNPVAGTFTWTTPGTTPPVGADPESVTFTPTDTADYNTVTLSVTVTVNAKITPTVTAWPTASTITYGQTLASSVLSGGTASVAGTFAWTTLTTAPGAGAPSESVTFTPSDTTDYNTVTSSITVTVLKATPAVTAWPTAGAISVGQALSASALTGGTATFNSNPVLGAFAWTTPGIIPPSGADAESVTFTPTDTTDYNTVTGSVTVTVNNKTTPTVTAWPTASGITYGQTLSASTLTGGTASVAGTFAWTTPTTAPGAGTPSESVTFTPTDTTDYNTVAGLVTVAVSKATPTVTTLPTASAISLGQTLAGSTLTGGAATFNSNPVPGTFTWTTPGTTPPVGADAESVTFTPTDTADYNTVTVSVTVTVNNKTTPTVTAWPTASTITYGQTLASSVLSGGTASVAGTFAWTTPTTAPGAGAPSESVTFTPNDTTDYNTVTGSVTVTVLKATPAVTAWPTAGAISVGQALSASTLTGGTATFNSNPVPGTFTWTTPGITPPSGADAESVTFTPTDTTDYNTVVGSVTVTVNNKTTPTVTAWPTASGITYGQTLASSTLIGGTASVAGTFGWTTPTTVPGAGTPLESVTFTPTDTTDYNTVAGLVTVAVSRATPTVTTLPIASAISLGQTLAGSTLTGGAATFNSNPVPGAFAWTNPATTPPAGADPESVTFTPTDTADYNTVTVSVTVTVNNKKTPTVTAWPTAGTITYGQTLASSVLTGGTASVAGTFAWTTPTTAPGAGAPSESVTFTPTDTTDYNTVVGSVTVTVLKATPAVTAWPTAGAISIGQALSASTLTGGTATFNSNPVPGTFTWTTPGITPPSGADAESVTFTPTDTTDYNTVVGSVTVTVNNKTTPTVTAWPTASGITYGQVLSTSTLTGGTASVAGTFAWTSPGTIPPAGADPENVTFTPTDTTDYNTVTGSVTVTVSKATPTVTTLPTASAISLGQTLAGSTLTGGAASVAGTFAWTTPGTAPPVGADPESVTFTPTDTADYNTVTVSVTVTVNSKKTPTVTAWPTASTITYGQTLASSVLSGGTASVAGTFAWTTLTTAPGAGAPSESVTFTPNDTTDYNTVTGSVTVTVLKATPAVTAWPTAGAISVGQALSASTLTGGTATFNSNPVPGTFAWTVPTTTPPTGTDSESVTFTPTDTTDYNTVVGSVSVTVNNKATPTVTAWPTAGAITYGQTLVSSVLTGGTASVAGTFAWTNPATAPGAGSPSESVTFTPTDTTDYNTVPGSVTVAVSKATPTVTTLPTASAISVGQALSASTLTGGTATFNSNPVAGTFAWTNPATIPTAGADPESVIFTPADTADYNTVTVSVTVTVNSKTTPTVTTWPTASSIYYGQTLASSVLTGGTASAAGTFTWTTPATAPGAGAPSESVTFTPTDTTDYNTVTGSVTVTVLEATPTVTTWPAAGAISLGQALSASTLTGGTATFNSNPVPGTFSWTTPGITPPVGANAESVTFTPTNATDYSTVTGSVTVTVNNKATPTVTAWPTASAVTYGQTLSSSTLSGGTASVAGTFAWTNPATAPGAGTPSESVTFTPTDTTDYNSVPGSVMVAVSKATPTVTTPPAASAISFGETLSASTLTGGTATFNSNPVPGIFTWTTPGITPPSGADAESVTFTPTDTADYNTVALSVTVTVNSKTTPTVTAWPTSSSIYYGQILASSVLTGGTASVAGTFAWTTPATTPGAGAPSESVTFTPTDTTDYNTVAGSITVTVLKATPAVTTWPAANAITYGQALSTSTLTGGAATFSGNPVPGTFSWTAPAIIPPAGAAAESVTFTPTDTTDYNTVTGSVSVTVNNQAVLTVTANNQARAYGASNPTLTYTITGFVNGDTIAVVSGAAACATTASATSPAGNYAISCAQGTLSATNYTFAFAPGTLTVTQATQSLTVTANNQTRSYGANNPQLTYTITGFVNGDTSAVVSGAAACTTAATVTSPASATPYPVTCTQGTLSASNYTFTYMPGALTVNPAALTVTGTDATRIYGTTNPPFTGNVLGAMNGDAFTESFTTVATIASNVGTYAIVPNAIGANLSDYSVTVQDGTLAITQAATTTSVTASISSGAPGQTVTLTAEVVSATTGTPTGSVSFYDGTTLLGTSPLTAGAASINTTSLTTGTSVIKAVYNGDSNFITSNSSTSIGVSSLDFSLAVSGAGSATVNSGNSATYQVSIAPLNGSYPGPVNFSASGMPPGALISFSPSTIAANGGQQTVTLTVQTSATAMQESPSITRKLAPLTLAFLFIPLLGLRRMRRLSSRLGRLTTLVLLLGCTLAAGTMMTGCVSKLSQLEKDYTITVTATSGNMQHATTVTLKVQ